MPLLNEILSSRFNRLLQAFLPLDEQEGAPTLTPEIAATLVLENDRPEWSHVKGERLRIASHSFLAAALQQATVWLHNTSVNQLVVVERIIIANSATDTVQIQLGANVTLQANVAVPAPRDLRFGLLTLGAGVCTADSIAGASVVSGAAAFQTRVLANTPYVYDIPFILAPGSQMFVNNITAATTLSVTYVWRERIAQPSELV